MVDKNVLQEKLKYLFLMELRDKYKILSFESDFDTAGNLIEGYYLHFKLSINSEIDPEINEFINTVENLCRDLSAAALKIQISSEGKIILDKKGTNIVANCLLFKTDVDYELGENFFQISIKVYVDE